MGISLDNSSHLQPVCFLYLFFYIDFSALCERNSKFGQSQTKHDQIPTALCFFSLCFCPVSNLNMDSPCHRCTTTTIPDVKVGWRVTKSGGRNAREQRRVVGRQLFNTTQPAGDPPVCFIVMHVDGVCFPG
jgi:hypothetical protein